VRLTAHEAGHGFHELRCLHVALGLIGLGDAVLDVAVEQTQRDLVQGGLDGSDLHKNVRTRPLIVDHPLDTADLSFAMRRSRFWSWSSVAA
jgi:hypothetical protein